MAISRLWRERKREIAVALTVLLAGCATSLPYIAPTDGAVARLLLRSNNLLPGRYVVDTFDDALRCSGPRTILESVSGKIDSAASIRAGCPISLRINCSVAGRYASYIVTFDAKPAHKYDVEPFSDRDFCGMVVFDVTSGERLLEPSARSRALTSYMEGGFCASGESSPVTLGKRNEHPKLGDLSGLLSEAGGNGGGRQVGGGKSSKPMLDGIVDLLPDSNPRDTQSPKAGNSKNDKNGVDDLLDLLPKLE